MRTYALEAHLATMMVTCGLALLVPGDTFILPHYAILKVYVGEGNLGLALMFLGVFRMTGVLLSGKFRYCPLFRLPGAMLGGGFWFAMTSFVFVDLLDDPTLPRNFGVPLLLPLAATAFAFEIVAAIKSSEDAARYDCFKAIGERIRGRKTTNGGRVL